MEIRKLPIGIQSFEDLRKNDYVYVDKTEYIWNLVSTGKTYFLSRPRRFGKSLLTSTIAAYFEGKKDLFKGLSIEKHENEKGKDAWQAYPVIYFSLAGGEYQAEDGLRETLETILETYEKEYGLNTQNLNVSNRFRLDIENIYQKTGKQVVVLVDEYDKPLLETMNVNPVQEEKNRTLYKSFFSVLKDEDAYLKFVFITGVTKFGKVSIFSDLNQPEDISLTDDYACVCGMTEEEIKRIFRPEILKMAGENEMSPDECMNELERMYDGYHFSAKSKGVYNPFSLMNALKQRQFENYWFSTGTPTFLINKLEKSDYTVEKMTDGVNASMSDMMDYRGDNPNPIPLLYQSGYLTIRDYDRKFRMYSLTFPNEEVRYGFLSSLVSSVLGNHDAEQSDSFRSMILDLQKGDVSSFLNRLKALFAGIPYIEGDRPSYEQEWRNEIYLILALMGQYVKSEVHTAKGRADLIAETKDYVYIFEFKVNQGADDALKQIEEKGYAEPYTADQRTVYKIGVSFSSEERNITEWKSIPEV